MKGATKIIGKYWLFDEISIHAPVKGATGLMDRDIAENLISIHAPVKGATAFADAYALAHEFQSTLP